MKFSRSQQSKRADSIKKSRWSVVTNRPVRARRLWSSLGRGNLLQFGAGEYGIDWRLGCRPGLEPGNMASSGVWKHGQVMAEAFDLAWSLGVRPCLEPGRSTSPGAGSVQCLARGIQLRRAPGLKPASWGLVARGLLESRLGQKSGAASI